MSGRFKLRGATNEFNELVSAQGVGTSPLLVVQGTRARRTDKETGSLEEFPQPPFSEPPALSSSPDKSRQQPSNGGISSRIRHFRSSAPQPPEKRAEIPDPLSVYNVPAPSAPHSVGAGAPPETRRPSWVSRRDALEAKKRAERADREAVVQPSSNLETIDDLNHTFSSTQGVEESLPAVTSWEPAGQFDQELPERDQFGDSQGTFSSLPELPASAEYAVEKEAGEDQEEEEEEGYSDEEFEEEGFMVQEEAKPTAALGSAAPSASEQNKLGTDRKAAFSASGKLRQSWFDEQDGDEWFGVEPGESDDNNHGSQNNTLAELNLTEEPGLLSTDSAADFEPIEESSLATNAGLESDKTSEISEKSAKEVNPSHLTPFEDLIRSLDHDAAITFLIGVYLKPHADVGYMSEAVAQSLQISPSRVRTYPDPESFGETLCQADCVVEIHDDIASTSQASHIEVLFGSARVKIEAEVPGVSHVTPAVWNVTSSLLEHLNGDNSVSPHVGALLARCIRVGAIQPRHHLHLEEIWRELQNIEPSNRNIFKGAQHPRVRELVLSTRANLHDTPLNDIQRMLCHMPSGQANLLLSECSKSLRQVLKEGMALEPLKKELHYCRISQIPQQISHLSPRQTQTLLSSVPRRLRSVLSSSVCPSDVHTMSLSQLTKRMSMQSRVEQQEFLQPLKPRMQTLCKMLIEADTQAKQLHCTPLQQIESILHSYKATYSNPSTCRAMVLANLAPPLQKLINSQCLPITQDEVGSMSTKQLIEFSDQLPPQQQLSLLDHLSPTMRKVMQSYRMAKPILDLVTRTPIADVPKLLESITAHERVAAMQWMEPRLRKVLEHLMKVEFDAEVQSLYAMPLAKLPGHIARMSAKLRQVCMETVGPRIKSLLQTGTAEADLLQAAHSMRASDLATCMEQLAPRDRATLRHKLHPRLLKVLEGLGPQHQLQANRHFMHIEHIQAVLSKLSPHEQRNALVAMPRRLRQLVNPETTGICKHMDVPCMKLADLVAMVHKQPSLASSLHPRLRAIVCQRASIDDVPFKGLEAIEAEILGASTLAAKVEMLHSLPESIRHALLELSSVDDELPLLLQDEQLANLLGHVGMLRTPKKRSSNKVSPILKTDDHNRQDDGEGGFPVVSENVDSPEGNSEEVAESPIAEAEIVPGEVYQTSDQEDVPVDPTPQPAPAPAPAPALDAVPHVVAISESDAFLTHYDTNHDQALDRTELAAMLRDAELGRAIRERNESIEHHAYQHDHPVLHPQQSADSKQVLKLRQQQRASLTQQLELMQGLFHMKGQQTHHPPLATGYNTRNPEVQNATTTFQGQNSMGLSLDSIDGPLSRGMPQMYPSFNELDANKDGVITEQEYATWQRRARPPSLITPTQLAHHREHCNHSMSTQKSATPDSCDAFVPALPQMPGLPSHSATNTGRYKPKARCVSSQKGSDDRVVLIELTQKQQERNDMLNKLEKMQSLTRSHR